jgi:RNA polymerase sigma factor (sigma-70 family)
MAIESASQSIREIRALYALGRTGSLTDGHLVERFLERDGPEREDAFAALVQRHGPMVLGVCRRMLPPSGQADADDAFQAVFLVLARRAPGVRRFEDLRSWLYGVAVRTASEARRRAARQRARERAAMDQSRTISAVDDGRAELLALLDEEIDRLPKRYRDPLMLCELEGRSRADAARQLALREGTLSSRLARGRSLLRDRLARRGLALGSGLFTAFLSQPASAAVPAPLADTTVRLAVQFTAGAAAAGTVPPAISSLAEGMLQMISLAKLKLILVAAMTLGAAACLTAGLAWAALPRGGAVPLASQTPGPVPKAEDKAKEHQSPRSEVHGVVVDELGQPVAGAEVLANAFTIGATRATTNQDGTFALSIQRPQVDGTSLLARSAGGQRLGNFIYGTFLTVASADAPARIVLKPAREVTVRVADADKAPVIGAGVEAAGTWSVLASETTGPDGTARLRIPADARVEWIVALKQHRGFEYAEFGQSDDRARSSAGAPATELPDSVSLVLARGRTARIKAVDRDGKPLAGVGFVPWLLHREGRRSSVNYSSVTLAATTGADGIANFDWLPPWKGLLQFWPVADELAHRRVVVEEGEAGTVTTKMSRTQAIRGRVLRADGSPLPGVRVQAFGSGQGIDHGHGRARTAADGTYAMAVDAGEAYAVSVDDEDWAAASRLDVVVREDQPVKGVDFKLTRGTVIRGTVTVGPAGRPAPKQYLTFIESGGEAPDELRQPGDRYAHTIQRQLSAATEADGHYSIRLGPGTYTVFGPPRTGEEKITIRDEPELVRDYRMPRPERGPLDGRVVHAGKGIAGAAIELFAVGPRGGVPFSVTSDADGRFHVDRSLDKTYICAKTPDGSLGAIVEIGAEDPEVVIEVAPTATASGVLLDEKGHIAARTQLSWGRRVYIDEDSQVSTQLFAPKVKTDAEGRFTLPALVVGQEYQISLMRDNVYHAAGAVRPERPGPIDLGTLRAGSYRENLPANAIELSSFRNDAPGAGDVAPPIEATSLDGKPLALGDFRGKYVLLDFWATWCGPCIAEIPQLQAVHKAFGADERFAILSLSVDDKIDEPRQFQEKRKLPWSQAFLGEGIHGPTPATFGVRAIPAFVLIGPDGKIVARGMRGDEIQKAVAQALGR